MAGQNVADEKYGIAGIFDGGYEFLQVGEGRDGSDFVCAGEYEKTVCGAQVAHGVSPAVGDHEGVERVGARVAGSGGAKDALTGNDGGFGGIAAKGIGLSEFHEVRGCRGRDPREIIGAFTGVGGELGAIDACASRYGGRDENGLEQAF